MFKCKRWIVECARCGYVADYRYLKNACYRAQVHKSIRGVGHGRVRVRPLDRRELRPYVPRRILRTHAVQ